MIKFTCKPHKEKIGFVDIMVVAADPMSGPIALNLEYDTKLPVEKLIESQNRMIQILLAQLAENWVDISKMSQIVIPETAKKPSK